jgi:hypothetical protein
MTRIRHCLPLITAACLTSIAPVQADNSAGVLREVQGTVWVNQGKNYVVGHSGMKLKPGARVFTLDGASAVVKQTDDSLTQLEPNSLFMLRELGTYPGGAATVREIGPDYTEAISADTTNDAPAVAAGATSGPSIDKANMALGGGAGAITGSTMETIEAIPQQQQQQVVDVDDQPPPVSAYR